MLVLEAAKTLGGIASVATRITYSVEGMELNAGVEVYKTLAQGQLPISAAALYTVPASTQAFIKSIHITNPGAVATFKLFIGGTADVNAITGTMTLAAGESLVFEDGGWRVTTAEGYDKMRHA